MIFTLPSSAAALALGSFAQCVRNTQDKPRYLHTGDRSDGFKRELREGIHVKPVPTDPTSEPTTWSSPEHVLVRYSSDMYVDERNRRYRRGLDGSYIDQDGNKFFPTAESSRRYTVAWVDDYGNLLGVHPKHSDSGRAIHGSCWTSLKPV